MIDKIFITIPRYVEEYWEFSAVILKERSSVKVFRMSQPWDEGI